MMTTRKSDERLIETITAHLDRSTETLDDEIARRLRQTRAGAVEAAGRQRLGGSFRWLTAGGVATAAILIVAGVLWMNSGRKVTTVANLDDMEIVTAREQIQFYEDLDFYRWLATQENGG
ncbi:hypothetical protein GURASL_07960 [Geotalea uraniireducens]|uniref:DUF3619 family protein n=1 Tax=Geotalea uraniireducens TaxID=351604 RepID=A0ABN6VNQ8_9BACT|nr:DUF3619 family protein [Geotalea uraniireducens]BDV41873.1 hypothetical protein GURASL_07960 [Geotalea uraniireducens]